MKLLSQGAEAKIYLAKNLRKSAKSAANSPAQFIIKTRIPKSYRHPQLDNQIRTRRTKSESKILTKAIQAKINVPRILNQTTKRPNDQTTDKFQIHMEFVPGDKLSQTLNDYPEQKQITAMKKLGRQVAKLHANNIIHSDLTTSNIILSSSHRRKPISQRSDLLNRLRIKLHLNKNRRQSSRPPPPETSTPSQTLPKLEKILPSILPRIQMARLQSNPRKTRNSRKTRPIQTLTKNHFYFS